ncbi:MAG: hypothetical protein GX605_03975, partial [Chloroflexi bacterium]|nr:hypothetical protein [Chloroflexota bacterium]
LQPERGFGKIWRDQLGGPAAAIGWALQPEQGKDLTWQAFQGGWVLEMEGMAPFIVFQEGRWENP